MKKLFAVTASAFIAAFNCVAAFAEGSQAESEVSQAQGFAGFSTAEIAITAVIMFAVIAVIGVMFAKVIQKDRNDIRGIRRK